MNGQPKKKPQWARISAWARRRPFTAFMLVILGNVLLWAAVFFIVVDDYFYRHELPGWSDFGPPIKVALDKYREADPGAAFTTQTLLEGLETHSDDYGRPARLGTPHGYLELASYAIDDDYGRGILLYYPGTMRGPFWRRRYACGVIVYEGLEHIRFVRLYRFPDEAGFSPSDIGQSRHGAWGLEPSKRTDSE